MAKISKHVSLSEQTDHMVKLLMSDKAVPHVNHYSQAIDYVFDRYKNLAGAMTRMEERLEQTNRSMTFQQQQMQNISTRVAAFDGIKSSLISTQQTMLSSATLLKKISVEAKKNMTENQVTLIMKSMEQLQEEIKKIKITVVRGGSTKRIDTFSSKKKGEKIDMSALNTGDEEDALFAKFMG